MTFALFALATATLYEQSLAKLLEARFSDPRISYVFVKTATGEIVGARWPDLEQPVPPGSLVKVFTALAYGQTHADRFPEFVCRGRASGCWLPHGHGRIGLVEAVAHSCNAYFRVLAHGLRMEDVRAVAQRFGVEPPPADATADTLVGLGAEWKIAPAALAQAYCRLPADPRATEILSGMALSAHSGTGSAVSIGLIKTGTAPCTHRPRSPGDGFVIALYPEGSPKYALLVRVHGATGARAAETMGRMLRSLRDGR